MPARIALHCLTLSLALAMPAVTTPMAAQRASRAGPDTATVPLELVAALLGSTGSDQLPELRVGGLVSGIPADVVPRGARVLGSLSSRPVMTGEPRGSSTVIMIVGSFPEDAVAQYTSHLDRTGWTQPPGFGQRGGFAATRTSRPTSFCRDSLFVIVSATLRPSGGAHLRLQFSPTTPQYSPCDIERRYPGGRPADDEIQLPLLLPPPGARSIGSGESMGGNMSSGGDGSATRASHTTLDAPLTPSEILAHYASQLKAAGWTPGAPTSNSESGLQVLTSRDVRGRTLRAVLTAMVVPDGAAPNERDVGLRVVRTRAR